MTKAVRQFRSIGWIRILLFIVPYVLIAGGFHALGLVAIREGLNHELWQLSSIEDLTYTAFDLLATLLSVWIFMRYVDKESFISLGFKIKDRLAEIGLGIGIGAFAVGLGFSIIWSQRALSFEGVTFNFNELLAAISLFIIVAINEEVLIRGYILKNLMVSFNKYLALLISAALFTFMHSRNPGIDGLALVNLFLAGLLLGSFYIYTRNLWLPIVLHFSWNFFQSIFGFNVSGHDSYSLIQTSISQANQLNGGEFGFEGSFISTVLLTLILIAVFYHFKRKRELIINEVPL